MGHAHAVNLVQDVVRQIVVLIETKEPFDSITGWNLPQELLHRAAIGILEEPLFLVFGERPIPKNMCGFGGELTSFEKAFQLVLETDLVIGYWNEPAEE